MFETKDISLSIDNNKNDEIFNDEILNIEKRQYKWCYGIFLFILKFISVFKIEYTGNNTNRGDEAMIAVRFLTMIFILSMSLPYSYYLRFVPDLIPNTTINNNTILSNIGINNSSIIFNGFMTIINFIPLCSFLMYLIFVVRLDNKKFIDKKSIIESYKYSNYEIDQNYENELQALSMVKNTLDNIRENRYNKWKIYMICASSWAIISWIMYIIWTSIFVLSRTCQHDRICFIFILLCITSIIRFSVPIFIIFLFAYECDITNDKIEIWYLLHKNKKIDISFVSRFYKIQIDEINNNMYKWQYVFLVTFILPIMSMLLLFITSLFDNFIIIVSLK